MFAEYDPEKYNRFECWQEYRIKQAENRKYDQAEDYSS